VLLGNEIVSKVGIDKLWLVQRQDRTDVLVRAHNNHSAITGDSTGIQDVLVLIRITHVLPVSDLVPTVKGAENAWDIRMLISMVMLLVDELDINQSIFIGTLWGVLGNSFADNISPLHHRRV